MGTESKVIDLTDIDMFVNGEHHDAFTWLRTHRPVYWNTTADGSGFWALTRYQDVVNAYRDHATFSSAGGAMMGGSFRSETDTASGQMLVASDPPRHRLLRQVMHRAFANDVVEKVRGHVRELVGRAIERMLADGGCDIATDVAPELPAGAIMGMVGVSHDAAHHLIGLTRQMIGYRDPVLAASSSADHRLHLAGIQAEIFEFFLDLMTERRRRPGDDLVSILMAATINGRPLTDEEMLYNCMNVAVGGNETSSYSACAGILALINDPAQLRLVAARPDLRDSAVNEILRWSSTNAYVQRIARQDVEIDGRRIRAGDVVTLWNVSANRDEEQFPRGQTFDVTRTPNRHLSYGSGGHRCIGAPVAQGELSILLESLASAGIGMVVAGEVEYLRSNFILGIRQLPVTVSGTSRGESAMSVAVDRSSWSGKHGHREETGGQ